VRTFRAVIRLAELGYKWSTLTNKITRLIYQPIKLVYVFVFIILCSACLHGLSIPLFKSLQTTASAIGDNSQYYRNLSLASIPFILFSTVMKTWVMRHQPIWSKV